MLIISILSSPINWIINYFNQVLIASKKISVINYFKLIQSIFYIFIILFSIYFKLTIAYLFLLIAVSETSINFLKLIPILRSKIIVSFSYYKFDWLIFKPVYEYSLKLLVLGFFLFVASKSRPLLLAFMSDESNVIAGNYKIMETLMNLPIAIVGSLSTIFFPKAIELLNSKNEDKISKYIYKVLNFTNFIALIIITPIICLSNEILQIWVGSEFQNLSIWIQIWCINAFIVLFKSPLNSFLLMKGDVKKLILISFVSCLFLIISSILLYDYFEIGSVLISYLAYVLLVFILENIFVYKSILSINRIIIFKQLSISICFLVLTTLFTSKVAFSDNIFLNSLLKLVIIFTLLFIFFGKKFFVNNFKFFTK
jgi:O-antigen/teichoic acid export membrane protein